MLSFAIAAYAANKNRRIGLQRSDNAGWTNTPHITFSTDSGADASIKISVIDSGVAGYADTVVINKHGNVGIGTIGDDSNHTLLSLKITV